MWSKAGLVATILTGSAFLCAACQWAFLVRGVNSNVSNLLLSFVYLLLAGALEVLFLLTFVVASPASEQWANPERLLMLRGFCCFFRFIVPTKDKK